MGQCAPELRFGARAAANERGPGSAGKQSALCAISAPVAAVCSAAVREKEKEKERDSLWLTLARRHSAAAANARRQLLPIWG